MRGAPSGDARPSEKCALRLELSCFIGCKISRRVLWQLFALSGLWMPRHTAGAQHLKEKEDGPLEAERTINDGVLATMLPRALPCGDRTVIEEYMTASGGVRGSS